MGVKGADRTLPLVPGIFPTMPLRDARDLVSFPRETRAVAGHHFAVAAPGVVNQIYVGAPAPIRLHRIMVCTDEPTLVTELGRGGGALPPTTNQSVAELTPQGGIRVGALGVAGMVVGMGSFVLENLDWRGNAGERFSLSHQANANVPYEVAFFVEWSELPLGSIEP